MACPVTNFPPPSLLTGRLLVQAYPQTLVKSLPRRESFTRTLSSEVTTNVGDTSSEKYRFNYNPATSRLPIRPWVDEDGTTTIKYFTTTPSVYQF